MNLTKQPEKMAGYMNELDPSSLSKVCLSYDLILYNIALYNIVLYHIVYPLALQYVSWYQFYYIIYFILLVK